MALFFGIPPRDWEAVKLIQRTWQIEEILGEEVADLAMLLVVGWIKVFYWSWRSALVEWMVGGLSTALCAAQLQRRNNN